jgi:UDP-GlcNAc:undecaprenyl-phosphate/decaprenyl-phosphate GlcNAc-1-phosphate transferase
MLNVFLISLVAFIITYLAIPAIMKVADEKKLFDLPDARKLHNRPIASLGGVGIFVGLFIVSLITISKQSFFELQYFFAAAIVIFFLGLKDDILILSPIKKFLGQLAAAAILIHLGGFRIDNMFGFMGLNEIPTSLGLLISYTTIIVVVNAYNLIDGVDGLAGMLGVLSTVLFGTYFLYAGLQDYAMLAFCMCACLIAFLIYNFYPAKIFMGDSGSLLLGLVNALLVIKFINTAGNPGSAFPLPSGVAIGFSILVVPLLDTLRVFGIRIRNKRSPFSPDRNHIHHLLLDRGLSHSQVTLSCFCLGLSFVAMAYFGRNFGSTLLISLMIFTMYALVGALLYFRKPVRKLLVAKSYYPSIEKNEAKSATKVVSINSEATAVEQ